MSRAPSKLPAIATISRKNQITLPRVALDFIGAQPGDRLSMERTNGGIIVRRIGGPNVVDELAGSLTPFVRHRRRPSDE